MNQFMIVLGAIMILFSAFFITAAATDLLTEPEPEMETLLAVIGFFSVTGMAGLYITVVNTVKHRRKKREQRHRKVLKVVAAMGGRVTPVQIAAETNLIIHDAKAILDQLCKTGMGRIRVTEDGNQVYEFKDFLNGFPKRRYDQQISNSEEVYDEQTDRTIRPDHH